MFALGPRPRVEPFDFPVPETAPVAYTPDRSIPIEFASTGTEMIVVSASGLAEDETYVIAGRALRISRQSDVNEFRRLCPTVQRLVRENTLKFYLAVPE